MARQRLIPKHVYPCLELGLSIQDPLKAKEIGFLDDTEKDLPSAILKAQDELIKYASVPRLARIDAKRKGRLAVLKYMTDEALDEVVESIAGDEFQETAVKIMASLKKK